MKSFVLHGHQVTVDILSRPGPAYSVKLYVDGNLRDESRYLKLPSFRGWGVFARAGVEDDTGQRRELRVEGRQGYCFGVSLLVSKMEYRCIYDGKEVGSG
jgi:hypothetical protein